MDTRKLKTIEKDTRGAQKLSYTAALAEALIRYAEKDEIFAETLAQLIDERLKAFRSHADQNPAALGTCANLLLPENTDTAYRRALWLIGNITKDKPQAQKENPAAAKLTQWARKQTLPEPKSIIIGIMPGAVPGFTLGKIPKRNQLAVVIRNDMEKKPSAFLARTVNRLTLSLVDKALERTGGNARKLEPDLADWFFGDKALALYTADADTLTDIAQELKSLRIPHTVARDENGSISTLAITPAVNAAELICYGLELLET